MTDEPLDRSARLELAERLANIRHFLLARAGWSAQGKPITKDDIAKAFEDLKAFEHLEYPNRDALALADAQSVITKALQENRWFEQLANIMAVGLFLFGLALLGVGVATDNVAVRVGAITSGTIAEALLLIPFRYAINSRRHNIALRMLGLILNRVHDPKHLAPLLNAAFAAVLIEREKP